jgi:transposase-like protein
MIEQTYQIWPELRVTVPQLYKWRKEFEEFGEESFKKEI